MTNEPIKPGFYWAKLNEGGVVQPIEVIAEGQAYVLGLIINLCPDDYEIIAPALPPDQWPTEQIMIEKSKDISSSFRRHQFERGFQVCYKLFTKKDLS